MSLKVSKKKLKTKEPKHILKELPSNHISQKSSHTLAKELSLEGNIIVFKIK